MSTATTRSSPFRFEDQGSLALLELAVPDTQDSATVRVETTADTVTVSQASQNTPLFKSSQLYGTVDASSTSWALQKDGTLRITLKKLPPYETWPTLETTAGAQPSETQPSPTDALEARKNVKALLEAAQSGDVDMLKVRSPINACHSLRPK